MDKPSFKLVGAPCGHHGQYTFYKALRVTGATDKIIAIGDFFFVRVWQDSELVSIGELQLLWRDRVSDQTLVSLRLYFLPENTPEGRHLHGEDEVVAISEKVVLRADDLLSWLTSGEDWHWGLRAVWRGACAPPSEVPQTAPLHQSKLDFSDIDSEKDAIAIDTEAPGVVVFSYPRYCRYRALLARLEGIQGDWLRDSLVAALGGYAAATNNTRILYCRDTFEYPELEGHELICSHLAPRLKGRPRGRRRRAGPAASPEPPSSGSDTPSALPETGRPPTPRRLSLRPSVSDKRSDDETDRRRQVEHPPTSGEDRAFLQTLTHFYEARREPGRIPAAVNNLSLRELYLGVVTAGGFEAVCSRRLWRHVARDQPARARRYYERYLLPFETYERHKSSHFKMNGKIEIPQNIPTIDVTDSPLREDDPSQKILRTPSPKLEEKYPPQDFSKEEIIISKNAEELNREFLDSLPKEEKNVKISVKPVEKLIESGNVFDGREGLDLKTGKEKTDGKEYGQRIVSDLCKLPNLVEPPPLPPPLNGHAGGVTAGDLKPARPVGSRSSLRAVRVKPTLARPSVHTPNPLRSDSASSSPPLSAPSSVSSTSTCGPPAPLGAPVTNFGIHHPPPATNDDDIVEVPYKPKTPEIIDLDEYPESPQAAKKKKLDILKERGLEVTPIPTWNPIPPIINPSMILNPAVQHQIMTQAQLFQMYNIIPPQNYANGIQPPKVVQGSSIFGTAGPEKTVYGNPKDPFMPPPHILHGAPVKPLRNIPVTNPTPQDILDLTCKSTSPSPQKPAVEILRVACPSPKLATPQNLSKNYTLVDGKAVVGSNQLEITLVNKAHSPTKGGLGGSRPPQKRSSNGKFMSTKTPTPPKDFPKFSSPTQASNIQKKNPINIPNYQIREDLSPTTTQKPPQPMYKGQNLPLAQLMELQKSATPMSPFMDPYAVALYSSLAGQMDQRQLAMYRELMANQMRGYPGLLNLGVSNTPTTKN